MPQSSRKHRSLLPNLRHTPPQCSTPTARSHNSFPLNLSCLCSLGQSSVGASRAGADRWEKCLIFFAPHLSPQLPILGKPRAPAPGFWTTTNGVVGSRSRCACSSESVGVGATDPGNFKFIPCLDLAQNGRNYLSGPGVVLVALCSREEDDKWSCEKSKHRQAGNFDKYFFLQQNVVCRVVLRWMDYNGGSEWNMLLSCCDLESTCKRIEYGTETVLVLVTVFLPGLITKESTTVV